jgi:hypothetical protein
MARVPLVVLDQCPQARAKPRWSMTTSSTQEPVEIGEERRVFGSNGESPISRNRARSPVFGCPELSVTKVTREIGDESLSCFEPTDTHRAVCGPKRSRSIPSLECHT